MKYIRLYKNSSEIGNGVDISKPSIVYLRNKNILYVSNNSTKGSVKYDSINDKIYTDDEIITTTSSSTTSTSSWAPWPTSTSTQAQS